MLASTAVAFNGAISAVIALPLVPVAVVGATPLPAMNQVTVRQHRLARIHPTDSGCRALGAAAPILTTNYGEAGAVDRFSPALGLSEVFKGHNELWFRGTR